MDETPAPRICPWHVKRRHPWLSGLSAVLLLTAALSLAFADRQIVINTSDSMPRGLYVRTSETPGVGRIIDFPVPPRARAYMRARTGHDGARWYILKTIVAGPGDRVCTLGGELMVNGKRLGAIMPRDGDGRPLPQWQADRRLGPDEYFAFSDRIPTSFDSRYFGPVTRAQIASVRRPVVTW
jgi:conjugative transfer signal peptidase TraF